MEPSELRSKTQFWRAEALLHDGRPKVLDDIFCMSIRWHVNTPVMLKFTEIKCKFRPCFVFYEDNKLGGSPGTSAFKKYILGEYSAGSVSVMICCKTLS